MKPNRLLAWLVLTAGTFCGSAGLRADIAPSPSLARLHPKLHWRYGWNDGSLANTTGSFRKGSPLPAGTSVLPSGGYTPAQIAHAYGFDTLNAAGGNGTNRTIAIVDAYGTPTLMNDLSVFSSQFGLPGAQVTVATPAGTPRWNDSGWAGETMLDAEWAHAMAPSAKILVVISPDDSDANLNACIQYAAAHADVVSLSWGGFEAPSDPQSHYLFTNSAVSFVAAAGDNGVEVDWPASDPSVLGVGGTSLILTSSNTVSSETAWSDGSGGVSRFQQIPAYQSGWTAVSGRSVPDVSYLADPYTGVYVYMTDPVYHSAGWSVYGGTSAGTPQWAALLACRMSLGGTSAFSNAALYVTVTNTPSGGLYTQNPSYLRDITVRQPANWSEPYIAYTPTTGFDLVTGLGSPIALSVSRIVGGSVTISTPSPAPRPTATPTPSPKPTPSPSPKPTPIPKPTPTPPSGGWGWWGWPWWR